MKQHHNENHRGRPRGYGALYFYYLAAPAYVPEPYVPPAQLFPQYLIYSTFEKMGNWRYVLPIHRDRSTAKPIASGSLLWYYGQLALRQLFLRRG